MYFDHKINRPSATLTSVCSSFFLVVVCDFSPWEAGKESHHLLLHQRFLSSFECFLGLSFIVVSHNQTHTHNKKTSWTNALTTVRFLWKQNRHWLLHSNLPWLYSLDKDAIVCYYRIFVGIYDIVLSKRGWMKKNTDRIISMNEERTKESQSTPEKSVGMAGRNWDWSCWNWSLSDQECGLRTNPRVSFGRNFTSL